MNSPQSPLEAALAVLNRVVAGLAARPDAEARNQLLELHEEAIALLRAAAPLQRLRTVSMIERVRRLERELRALPAGERQAAICARLNISRSRFYELRAQAKIPEHSRNVISEY